MAVLISPFNSAMPLVDGEGTPTTSFQKLLQNLVNVAMQPGFSILLPSTSPVPSNWVQIDTLVIGANTYRVIQPK
jgi:hypothetical protein